MLLNAPEWQTKGQGNKKVLARVKICEIWKYRQQNEYIKIIFQMKKALFKKTGPLISFVIN